MDVLSQKQKSPLALDPRTKFIILFTVGFFVFSNLSFAVELCVFLVLSLFLVSYRQYSFTLKFGIVYLVMLSLDIFVVPFVSGAFGALFLALVKLPRYVLLILLAANLLIKTTSVSEFTAAFRKMHIPEQIIIPFSVMFRFIPTIQEEWRSIQNAMKLRGVVGSVAAVAKAPMQTLEYGLVPILMSVSTISNELAAASLSRGLEAGNDRTCLTEVRFRAIDYLMVALCALFIVVQVAF